MKNFPRTIIALFLVGIFSICIGVVLKRSRAQSGPNLAATVNPPALYSWQRNLTGQTGFNNQAANVQLVRYSANYVYVSSSGIPSFSIGSWPGNPNTAIAQSFVFKIPRNPVVNNGTKTSTPLGAIGVWSNGVVMFNALDARSYQNQNIWHQNAPVAEAASFDSCSGHPQMTGVYHNHQNPKCHYTLDATKHSPLLGYAFDGFPIYGAYGFANTNGTGGIKRMVSSYQLRSLTQRQTLPDGTQLSPAQYGPDVSGTFPLGLYQEDYQFIAGSGDLDQYNGRIAVTPEYPNGTYAYFVTINADTSATFPYILGTQYYGVVATENLTTQGHVTVSEAVTTFAPKATADFDGDGKTDVAVYRGGTWYAINSSSNTIRTSNFGLAGDRIAPGDYDGDGKNDLAVFRNGVWYITYSSNNALITYQFGASGDTPQARDYDGDGKTDISIFRPSSGTWYIVNSSDNSFRGVAFGVSTDVPVAGDFDGDSKADVAVFRDGVWYSINSLDSTLRVVQFGSAGDKPVVADYDGDGKADAAVYRPSSGTWYMQQSTDGFTGVQFGASSDLNTQGDYDGDGKTDVAVFRPASGDWYIYTSAIKSFRSYTFGLSGDSPVPAGLN